MEAGTSEMIAFLIVGAVLVFIDGQLIRRSGTTYLQAVAPDPRVADSMNQLITVLFHLAVLGAVALISIVPMNLSAPLETVVGRTGVTLLVLAAAHGITIRVLSRLRAEQEAHTLQEEFARAEQERNAPRRGTSGSPESRSPESAQLSTSDTSGRGAAEPPRK